MKDFLIHFRNAFCVSIAGLCSMWGGVLWFSRIIQTHFGIYGTFFMVAVVLSVAYAVIAWADGKGMFDHELP